MIRNTCAFTGHRPHKFPWKTNEADPRCVALESCLSGAGWEVGCGRSNRLLQRNGRRLRCLAVPDRPGFAQKKSRAETPLLPPLRGAGR